MWYDKEVLTKIEPSTSSPFKEERGQFEANMEENQHIGENVRKKFNNLKLVRNKGNEERANTSRIMLGQDEN